MSAEYKCDMCGEEMFEFADATVTTRDASAGTDEFHFCDMCTETHIAPILKKATEALEERAAAWRREFERKRRQHAADNPPAGTTGRPGFW